ncbi:MAG: uroporphyrinogen-III C-methyltransferase [Nitrosomonadales bacterium]|nr:uroporphyrinogen-III C-methyltransferase [Nitrosomonadales bacterium]
MPDAPEPPVPVRPAQKNSPADIFSRITLTQMTLAALAVIFLWQWLDGHRAIGDMQRQLAQKIAEMDGAGKANQVLLAQSQDEVRELSARLSMMDARYAEAQDQRAALEVLYNDLSVSRDETALAEVEQLLLIAGQQLQLSANVKAALIAMQSADERLQRTDRPVFNRLRKVIGQDMDKLRALPDVDVAALNFQLDDLSAGVDALPLAYQRRATEAAAETHPREDGSAWQKLLREIGREAGQLVRIENTGKSAIPLVAPDQKFFLRENLKLRLLSARLALLSRDQESFRREIKTAQLWTARYFDEKSKPVAQMQKALGKFAQSDIDIELPDISASLQAVRTQRLSRENEAKASR